MKKMLVNQLLQTELLIPVAAARPLRHCRRKAFRRECRGAVSRLE